MASNKTSFENFLKDKLDGYELPYDHNDWLKLEKDMPAAKSGNGGKFSGTALKIAAVVSITTITVLSILYFVNQNTPEKKQIANQQISAGTEAKSPVVSEVTPAEVIPSEIKHVSSVVKSNQVKSNEVAITTVIEINNLPVNTVVSQVSTGDEVKPASKNETATPSKPNVGSQVPNVMFSVDITEGCEPLKVTFIPSVRCDSMEYVWDFGNGETSSLLKPVYTYHEDGFYTPKLSVKYKKSKLSASFTLEQPVVVKPAPNADFDVENISGIYVFTNRTVNSAKVKWLLANGEESTDEIAKQSYKLNGTYNISLLVTGIDGCSASITKEIKIDVFAKIQFPTAFNPNGDGFNDFFGPIGENLSDYQYEIGIYNRFGQLVFESKDPKVLWDGKIKGSEKPADSGVYAYEAIFKDKYGNSVRKTGHVSLWKN